MNRRKLCPEEYKNLIQKGVVMFSNPTDPYLSELGTRGEPANRGYVPEGRPVNTLYRPKGRPVNTGGRLAVEPVFAGDAPIGEPVFAGGPTQHKQQTGYTKQDGGSAPPPPFDDGGTQPPPEKDTKFDKPLPWYKPPAPAPGDTVLTTPREVTGDEQSPEVSQQRENERVARLNKQRIEQDEMAGGAGHAQKYLAKNDLLNEYTSEDVYLRNEKGDPKLDPTTGEPLVRPEFIHNQTEAEQILAGPNVEADAAQAVNVRDYESSVVTLDASHTAYNKIKQEQPMEAASMSKQMNELLDGMEAGEVPMWARPAVDKVEAALASRGISASSVGRDSLFSAIINAAMPIAQADAGYQQQANQVNFQARAAAIMSDVNQEFAAKQFNATSDNQRNQFLTQTKAAVDGQNAARADAMEQFNAGNANALEKFNTQLEVQREQFNTNSANLIEQATVQWRRQLNTMETAGINAANQANVANAFAMDTKAQAQLWQEVRDEAQWAEQANESELQKRHEMAMEQIRGAFIAAEGDTDYSKEIKDKLFNTASDALLAWLGG